jgi:hypothetical protein
LSLSLSLFFVFVFVSASVSVSACVSVVGVWDYVVGGGTAGMLPLCLIALSDRQTPVGLLAVVARSSAGDLVGTS